MIDQLTPEQEARIPHYIEKWKNIDKSTDLIDRPKAEAIIEKIYAAIDYKKPPIRWAESIFKVPEILKEYDQKFEMNSFCFGNNDSGYLVLIDFLINEIEEEKKDGWDWLEKIQPVIEYAEIGGWFYPLDELCICVEKPEYIGFNEAGRLHCEHGPAFKFRCGKGYYFLNGVSVSKELVETTWNKLDPVKYVLQEKNAEIRREAIRKIGTERFIESVNADCIDKAVHHINGRDMEYELLMVPISPEKEKRPYLKMINPSIGTYHIEGVSPECRTVKEALKFRNVEDGDPIILT